MKLPAAVWLKHFIGLLALDKQPSFLLFTLCTANNASTSTPLCRSRFNIEGFVCWMHACVDCDTTWFIPTVVISGCDSSKINSDQTLGKIDRILNRLRFFERWQCRAVYGPGPLACDVACNVRNIQTAVHWLGQPAIIHWGLVLTEWDSAVCLHTFHCAYRVASCFLWSGSSWSSLVGVNPIGFGIWNVKKTNTKHQYCVWNCVTGIHYIKYGSRQCEGYVRAVYYLRRGAFSSMSSSVSSEERWEMSLRLGGQTEGKLKVRGMWSNIITTDTGATVLLQKLLLRRTNYCIYYNNNPFHDHFSFWPENMPCKAIS